MRSLFAAALAAGFSVAAQAQLSGGVTGAIGAATGPVEATARSGTAVNAGRNVVDTKTDAAGDAEHAVSRSARGETRRPIGTRAATVNGGASVHVARETRCYDGTDYYDPDYGDGYYYCETSGPRASAEVGAEGHR